MRNERAQLFLGCDPTFSIKAVGLSVSRNSSAVAMSQFQQKEELLHDKDTAFSAKHAVNNSFQSYSSKYLHT